MIHNSSAVNNAEGLIACREESSQSRQNLVLITGTMISFSVDGEEHKSDKLPPSNNTRNRALCSSPVALWRDGVWEWLTLAALVFSFFFLNDSRVICSKWITAEMK